jgi:beta-phosphoglucomutase
MDRPGVIFDMDGVLVDSYDAHFHSWQKLAAKHGLSLTEEEFAATFGRTSRAIIEALWPDAARTADMAAWDAEKEAGYRELLKEHFPAMDGAEDLLDLLAEAGFALAIGSSGPPENVQVVMEQFHAARHISATVNGTEVKRGKPDPGVFLLAAKKLRVEPRCCAVVEDAPAGVAAARRANMAAIALTGTVEREKLNGADLIVDSLRDLTPGKIRQLIESRGKRG